MHIPDNYLSPASCAVLAVAAAPVVGLSITKVKAQLKENKELAPMLGIAASLSFLLMMFNVPIPGGTTAHAVGGVLLSILSSSIWRWRNSCFRRKYLQHGSRNAICWIRCL